MSRTAAEVNTQQVASAAAYGPGSNVIRAAKRYDFNPDALRDEAGQAWFRFLAPFAGAALRQADTQAGMYAATTLATYGQELIDGLGLWEPLEAAVVLDALAVRWASMVGRDDFDLDFARVLGWIREHKSHDRADAVATCIAVTPPREVEIEGRLPMTGYQKRVFTATWRASGRRQPIVLKEFLGDAGKVIPREMQAYPLSMMHPNIIQTYRLENPTDSERPFLAERRIHPLSITWKAEGLAEAAQVLTDVARALAFLTDQGLVHGDIKPDNIGYDEGRFILLDFGVARPATKFAELKDPTGTLSTRAPEVIRQLAPQSFASDVYALAATVLKLLYGSFPLIADHDDRGEPHTAKRESYIASLRKRLEAGWQGDLTALAKCTHDGFRDLLVAMLTPNPKDRPAADEVLRTALKKLPALIGSAEGPLFRPWEELDQMDIYLSPEPEGMRLLTRGRATDLDDRIGVLEQGLATEALVALVDEQVVETVAMLQEDLPPAFREELEAVRDELVRQREEIGRGVYEDLVQTLRDRVGQHDGPWPTIAPEGKKVLESPLTRPAMDAFGTPRYRARMRAVIEALERRRQFPPW